MNKNTKNINIEVHKGTWTKLKLIAISKDITLQDVVRDILDRAVSKKVVEVPEIN